MRHIIYGLADPNTRQIRYIGKTSQTAEARFSHHLWAAKRGNPAPLYEWIRGLQPTLPVLVVLQVLEGPVGRVRAADGYENPIAAAETKWMKRFRRSGLFNRIHKGSRAYKRLKNPGESDGAGREEQ
jgi:hypothetical protein